MHIQPAVNNIGCKMNKHFFRKKDHRPASVVREGGCSKLPRQLPLRLSFIRWVRATLRDARFQRSSGNQKYVLDKYICTLIKLAVQRGMDKYDAHWITKIEKQGLESLNDLKTLNALKHDKAQI